MADGIAGEARQRRRPIRHVGAPDRAQREQVVKGERGIAARDEQRGERDVAPSGGDQRLDHFARTDRAQDAIERDAGDRDQRHAERGGDPAPADLLVAEHGGAMQGVDPAIRVSVFVWRFHRSVP